MTKSALLLAALLTVVGCSADVPTPTMVEATLGPASATPQAAPDIRSLALEIALADGRLNSFLERHPYTVEPVRLLSGNRVDLYIQFDDEVPLTEWPHATCGTTPAIIDGVHWRIDLLAEEVVALSPTWGEGTCLTFS